MTIRNTQLAMGFSRQWGSPTRTKPTCDSCSHRLVTTEPHGTFAAGSLKCTKGGFITQPLATCNEHRAGDATARHTAVRRT